MTGLGSMRVLEGELVGDYLLREHLGEGAFAGVFLSEQRMLGEPFRDVALKLSRRTGMTAGTARELFKDAFLLARAMDSITDTEARLHLVHVYDAGISATDRRAYLAMEYVRGTTLASRFARQSTVDAAQITAWARQIGKALRALHGLDPPLVHRDLKPDNVLLGMDNLVRLVDFGLAERLLSLGYMPGVAGTLAYMAPEASRGASLPASDVYSLGLLMYEGLTGEHAFRHLIPPVDLPDEDYGSWLYEAKKRHPALPPSALSNTVDPKLDAIVRRCLEFEPGKRFHDAAEFLEELNRESPIPGSVDSALREPPSTVAGKRLHRARHDLEARLAEIVVRDKRFEVLQRLGEVLTALGEHAEAARRLGEAWQLTRTSAILRDTGERVALLGAVAGAYRLAGNEFQARRYETEQARERGGGR